MSWSKKPRFVGAALVCVLFAASAPIVAESESAPAVKPDFPIPDDATLLERSRISVPTTKPRTFIYTNKRAAFYAGMTSGPNADPNQGLNVFGRKVLEDYSVSVDGVRLDRSAPTSVEVYPHAIVRRYAKGIEEEVSTLDGEDAIVVTLTAASTHEFELTPLVAGGASEADREVNAERARLFVTPREGGDLEQKGPRTVAAFVADLQPPAPGKTARDRWATPERVGIARRRQARFVIAVGKDKETARALAVRLPNEAGARLAARRARIARSTPP